MLIVLILLSLNLTGCEAFRKKFVRTAQREKEVKVITQIQEYPAKYSTVEIYQRHFSFWLAAQDELIELIDVQNGSYKRRLALSKRTVDELGQMQALLLTAQQEALDSYIARQKDIARQLEERNLSRGQWLRIRVSLEKQRKNIRAEFALKKIKDFLNQK